ncbi:MAG: hypothetical protein JOY57_06995, partial [Actinobacteria bacterium]|nr:hypothetical protein [Actinomycetota bacterium]
MSGWAQFRADLRASARAWGTFPALPLLTIALELSIGLGFQSKAVVLVLFAELASTGFV